LGCQHQTPGEDLEVARRLNLYAARLIARAQAELANPPAARRGPGRPRIEPTAEQIAVITKFSTKGHRRGLHELAKLTGLSWWVVQRIREELDAS
jgi:hypothetical protein